MNLPANLGLRLLAVYLIASGVAALLGLSLGPVLPIFAIVVGVCLLLGK